MNKSTKYSKVLFILHMPPPVHGASMVGKYIHDSKIINNAFECHYLNLALAKDLDDIGKGGIRKLKEFYKQLKQIRKQTKLIVPQLCYVTPNAKGGAFYKDFFCSYAFKNDETKHRCTLSQQRHSYQDKIDILIIYYIALFSKI